MSNLPSDVVNQALDAIGCDLVIGDLEEGTKEAQVCLRAYDECVRQLLRSAHWDFARKTSPLNCIGDASGNTPGASTSVPIPWLFEYAYPTDCLKARFVPANPYPFSISPPPGNIAISPTIPLTTGQGPYTTQYRLIPTRFVVATDFNNLQPLPPSQPWWEQPGQSPTSRSVILTNVKNAQLIYTAYIPYPNMWDSQFRAALVAYLASEVALTLSKDKKFGLSMRNTQIAIAKDKIREARVSDGNEGWYNTDHIPEWITDRYRGTGNWGSWGGGTGPGILGYGFDNCGFSDGTAY